MGDFYRKLKTEDSPLREDALQRCTWLRADFIFRVVFRHASQASALA
jgi:hypothetical protein